MRYLKIYGLFLSQYLKMLMQSKVNFFIGLMAFFLNQASGIIFLYLIFKSVPNLSGWSLDELIFIYGFAQIPRGIDHILTDYIWIFAGHSVVNGEFDRYLLRPLNPFFQVIAQRFQPDGFGELIIGLILFFTFSGRLSLHLGAVEYLVFILMALFGAVIYTSIKLFFASIAFWTKRSQSMLFVFYQIGDFAKYPLNIFSRTLRVFITAVIPYAFTAYIPAAYFLQRASLLYALGGCILAAVVSFTIAYSLWNLGMNSYESAGN